MAAVLDFLAEGSAIVIEAQGCEQCGRSRYRGRTGIYELVVIDDAMRELIHDKASEQQLVRHVRRACPGIISVQEVMRVALSESG